MGAVAAAVAELVDAPRATVDRRLASFWVGASLRPHGWKLPPAWDPVAGDYRTNDGWIRLHTNAPQHRRAALAVLDVPAERDRVAHTVGAWAAEALETAIVDAGGCAAAMRRREEWLAHPQGRSVACEPLLDWEPGESGPASDWRPRPDRPLGGVRVLDLTRVLAGPVCTRSLAGFGAEVLRLDPLDWQEDSIAPIVTLGKRCARLDLRADPAVFERLLAGADILVHGYRPGALDGLGFDAARRRAIRPGLIEVCLDAYGWTGPWRGRRGFDSLVQMSAGIADAGMRWADADKPTPLPVQALDHATGYMMAAAAIRGLTLRLRTGRGVTARAALARTAHFLFSLPAAELHTLASEEPDDYGPTLEQTSWGPAFRLHPPCLVEGAPMRWDLPASALGSALPLWTN